MSLSPTAIAEVLLPEVDDREICLITMTHASWPAPVRLSTDATTQTGTDEATGTPIFGTVSRGNTYLYLPISPVVPDSRDETPPTAKLSIDNVSRVIAPYLMMIDDAYPKVTIEVVLASSPDVVDQIWPEFDLTDSTIDVNHAETTIGMDIASNEPMPWLRFSEAYFQNLFDK